MKVSIRATWFIIIITLIYTASVCVSGIMRLQHIQPNRLFQLFNEVAFIIPVIYITMILHYLREKTMLVIAYSIYIVTDIIIVSYYLLFTPSVSYMMLLLFVFAGTAITITNVMFILSLNMQNQMFVLPYCLFCIIFVVIDFFKAIGSLLIMFGHADTLYQSTIPAELLLPIAMLYLLFKTLNHLIIKRQQFLSISEHVSGAV